jgi:hypothetical protein
MTTASYASTAPIGIVPPPLQPYGLVSDVLRALGPVAGQTIGGAAGTSQFGSTFGGLAGLVPFGGSPVASPMVSQAVGPQQLVHAQLAQQQALWQQAIAHQHAVAQQLLAQQALAQQAIAQQLQPYGHAVAQVGGFLPYQHPYAQFGYWQN